MSPGLLRSTRRVTARFVVLAVTLAGASPLAAWETVSQTSSALLAGTGGNIVQPVSATPSRSRGKASMTTLKVPEVAAGVSGQGLLRQRVQAGSSRRVVAELGDESTQDFGMLGVTWQAGTASQDLRVQVRTRTDGRWTAWQDLEIETTQTADASDVRGGTSPTYVGQSDGVGVRLLSASEAPEDVRLALIDGGTGLAQPAEAFATVRAARVTTSDQAAGAADGDVTASTTGTTTTAVSAATTETTGTTDPTIMPTATTGVAPKPVILTRSQWGVDSSTESPCDSPLTAPSAHGVVLHHTAGANGYSKEEAPGIVRGIHLYHTRSLGWCDIGYNFLVDAYGTIYAGRRGGQEKQVRGAHAGNWDANLYLTGISMVGNYDTAQLTPALKESVVSLTAWRLSYFGLSAIGKTTIAGKQIPIISGHRDIYTSGIRPATSTACPGKYGYEWLNGGMRQAVQARIDAAPPQDDLPEEEIPGDGGGQETPTPTTYRMAGDNRYATAAAISRESFPNPGGTVFLTSGESFPDALSGGPAAAGRTAPVLLSRQDSLPSETVTELKRLAPTRIYILGGTAAVSSRVFKQAQSYSGEVMRLAGSDRYGTGVKISQATWPRAATVYVASGLGYADALSGGALAASQGAPILLSSTDSLPGSVKSEIARLRPSKVVILGGVASLTRRVRQQIAATVPSATVSRLSGPDRYATSAAIVRSGWQSAQVTYFAGGANFPDALAGVPAAGSQKEPLLLTRVTCLPPAVADVADALASESRVLLGGVSVLEDGVATTRCQ